MMRRSTVTVISVALLASTAWAQEVGPAGDLPVIPSAPTTPPATIPEVNLPAAAPTPVPAAAATPAPEPVPQPTGTVAAPADTIQAPIPAEATTAVLPTVPVETTVAATSGQTYSFGDAQNSLLFTSAQIANMKKALMAFETIRPEQEAAGEVTFTEALPIEPTKINEPTIYPVYQLSSIAYRTPNDWTVWLNNARITPKMNNGEVKVTAVKPDRVWFTWQPEYMVAVAERASKDKFADTSKVKHRFTAENTATFDRQAGLVRFSLKPNQSFAPAYFHTFEGRVASPALNPTNAAIPNAAMTPQAAEAINGLLGDANAPAPAAGVDKDRSTMEELISNQRRLIPQPQPMPATTTP